MIADSQMPQDVVFLLGNLFGSLTAGVGAIIHIFLQRNTLIFCPVYAKEPY